MRRGAVATVTTAAPPSFSDAYVRYALALIFLVAVFNVCDRTIMSVLVPEMRAELGLTDRQLGILMGPAFAAVHVVAGLPIARPRRSRGPFFVGDLIARLRPEHAEQAVRYALAIVSGVPLVATGLFAVAARTVREDVQRARQA
jgi:hypothetical protein